LNFSYKSKLSADEVVSSRIQSSADKAENDKQQEYIPDKQDQYLRILIQDLRFLFDM